MQFLLRDAPPRKKHASPFASGLLSPNGTQKPSYSAYRLPLYLPVTSAKRGQSLEVWGDVRPADFISMDTHQTQTAQIQFQRNSRGAFTTVKSLAIHDPHGYFDLHLKFPASGTVRLSWTYPKMDPFLPMNALGAQVFSRHVQLTLH